MVLFLDRFPFQVWTDYTRDPPAQFWSIVLPVILTAAPSVVPSASAVVQLWALDTGNRG